MFFELLRCCFRASWLLYQPLQMWHRAIDEQFTVPLAISRIVSQHTPISADLISPHNDDCTRSVCKMKFVVLVFKDPHCFSWPMIVSMQKWFTIFNLLIQCCSVPCSCSTVRGGWCSIGIMIACIWDQTSVNYQFYFIYYHYDISMKPRIT